MIYMKNMIFGWASALCVHTQNNLSGINLLIRKLSVP